MKFNKEILKEIFTVNRPIGRLTYFLQILTVFLIQSVVIATYMLFFAQNQHPVKELQFIFYILTLPACFIICWINCILTIKRLWDITGKKILSVFILIIFIALMFLIKEIKILYLVIFILPGKLSKKDKKTIENSKPLEENREESNFEKVEDGRNEE